ncbi:PP2C family protein-serine/threonine phosphatase [Streptomonospora nanhaiensis]|uniref:PPM-type phosphatase domain-containing protein n=1 Tax=Streptomonospora nanhaiensis TaxID=1323731 RepID=A0A853BFY3_9ACTN|nr:PP2C family protein-serine/threonine phosphatase [Streptomonospora nanhaiensis]MBV2366410.1 serine/threonine-protein phosphatase [Streptomonospora nanhaiensis]MBX9389953.1 serine/threonine-protein phosphatase [Streptomonospora nanhaiensis]NYI94229.1 hypothetical protein [Streptomonospora nanhaiensis]
MVSIEDSARMLHTLLRSSHLCSFEELPELIAGAASEAGLADARILLVDMQEEVLCEATGRGRDAGEGGQELRIDSTLPGRVFRSAQAHSGPGDGRFQHWLPILDGTERLGVLHLSTEHEADALTWTAMADLASLTGMLVVSKRPHSDSFARLTRIRSMSVSAEMQWTLMPPRVFANRRVTVAAAMEPAYATAGDAYDYALSGDTVHLALFDAMGHDTSAGLTANLALASCRRQRRAGSGLAGIRDAIEATLLDQFDGSRYATAVFADLDLATGRLTWMSCGHPPPILIRGGRWIAGLYCTPTHPLGTDLGLAAEVCREQLEPGDRLLLYTDGITEARDARGREFGRDHFVNFVIRHQADGLAAPETLRRLVAAVLRHHDGRLNDDATVLMCEWHGDPGATPGAPVQYGGGPGQDTTGRA